MTGTKNPLEDHGHGGGGVGSIKVTRGDTNDSSGVVRSDTNW